MSVELDVNQAGETCHDAAATLCQLYEATTDVRQALMYKYLRLNRTESAFFKIVKMVGFSHSVILVIFPIFK